MILIEAPQAYDPAGRHVVFLAGSIEMGRAVDWQTTVVQALAPFDGLVLNPRRRDWDSTWVQSKDNPPFREQVEWELTGIERATILVINFDPTTQSPITLFELGLSIATNAEAILVCCPEGFWRRGNVEIVCQRYGFPCYATLEALMHDLCQLQARRQGVSP